MVCDLYQDLMRINIRRNPNATATVFLPTCDPRIVTRVLRLMRGVEMLRDRESPPERTDGELCALERVRQELPSLKHRKLV